MSNNFESTVTVEHITQHLTNNGSEQCQDDIPLIRLPKKKKYQQKRRDEIYGLIRCKECKKIFDNKSNLNVHMLTHSNEAHKCLLCEKIYSNKKYLSRHMRNVHGDKKNKFKCDFCDKTFPFKTRLENHERIHTGEKPYKCHQCDKAFSSLYSRTTHMYIHTGEKPFSCSYCEYKCRDTSTLRKHQANHLGASLIYECRKCDKTYKNKWRLKLHVAEVHLKLDMRHFKCEQCSKGFKTRNKLNFHVRTVHERKHTAECEICHFVIANKANMASHLLTHSELRPFACDVPDCGKSYKSKNDLSKHRILHFPEKHHACPNCGKLFSRKERFLKHLKVHQGRIKNKECDYCGVCFYTKNYLEKHIRTKHSRTRQKFVCERCDFVTYNKPSIVMHVKYETCLKENDRKCSICSFVFNRHAYLRLHYWRSHGIRYKTPVRRAKKQNAHVAVKQELIEVEEHDLLEELAKVEDYEEITHPVDFEAMKHRADSEDVARIIIKKNSRSLLKVPEQLFDDFYIKHSSGRMKKRVKEKGYIVDAESLERSKADVVNKVLRERRKTAAAAIERARRRYNERLRRRNQVIRQRIEEDLKTAPIIQRIKHDDECLSEKEEERRGENTNNNDTEENDELPLKSLINHKATIQTEVEETKSKINPLMKTKLVKKGNEWVVYTEKCRMNLDKYMLPEFKKLNKWVKYMNLAEKLDEDDYIDDLTKLSVIAKKERYVMVFPCDQCIKVCRNLTAVEEHRILHEIEKAENDADETTENDIVSRKVARVKYPTVSKIINNKRINVKVETRTPRKDKTLRVGKKTEINLNDEVVENVSNATEDVVKDKICDNIVHNNSNTVAGIVTKNTERVVEDKLSVSLEQDTCEIDKKKDLEAFFKNNIVDEGIEFDQFVEVFKQIDSVKKEKFGAVDRNTKNAYVKASHKYVRVIRLNRQEKERRNEVRNKLRLEIAKSES